MNTYVRRQAKAPPKKVEEKKVAKAPKLEDFIKTRDYTGAVILLEYQKQTKRTDKMTLPWLAYAAFHLGDYQKAYNTYKDMIIMPDSNPVTHLYAACCLFYMGRHEEAEVEANLGPETPLKNRIFFHLAHKQGDEKKLMSYHQKMENTTEDQLSLASIHYLRSHYQESTDIYKRLLNEYRDYLALHVYVALCYYKLDYYDVSLEILAPYLQTHQDSAIAINLKACNHYKLYGGKEAEVELKPMADVLSASSQNFDNELLRHNQVVFRKGDNALQVLPPLLDVIAEARLNLVIYHLHNNETKEAYDLLEDLEPTTPQEYILKGVVNAAIGQLQNSPDHLKLAQQFFKLVGASASECDTIPGRQCMASCFFLLKQFDDVLIYLNSVRAYSYTDSIFSYNYGIALAASGDYKKGEENLLMVQEDAMRSDYCYLSWLARCYIQNGKPRDAWELYLKMESNTDSFQMLVLISNDCYKMGSFFYAAKAYDVLERLDPSIAYWEGKRGACCGVFQQVIAGREKKERLREILRMLQNNNTTPQAEFMIRVISKWAEDHDLHFS